MRLKKRKNKKGGVVIDNNDKTVGHVKLIGKCILILIAGIIGVAIFNGLNGRVIDYTLYSVIEDWTVYIVLCWIVVICGLVGIIYGGYNLYKLKTSIENEQAKNEESFKTDAIKANGGDNEAQFSLGMRYYKGDGITQDYAMAYQWWSSAAEQGHRIAQFNLGIMNEKGEGVSPSDEEALKWYIISAEQEYHSALNKIGEFYRDGRAVPQSDEEAFTRFETAAKAGNIFAQYNIGIAYLEGKGCEANRERGINFLSRSAEGNNTQARQKLNELLGGKSGF